MKATGIVRRIDDLGRVVIPREIRRSLRIREGDPLEIFVEQDGLVFRKYNYLESVYDPFIVALLATLETKGIDCAVYDRDGYRYKQGKKSGMPKEMEIDTLENCGFTLTASGEIIGYLYVERTEAEQGIIQNALTMFKELVKTTEVGD